MKKSLYNMLSVFAGILLALIIINAQINQRRGNSEPISNEERQNLYQQYLDYERGE